ncbi:MAG: DUF4928 family protein [Phycisphaerae bacterium]
MDSFKSWYRALRSMKQYGGRPAKGTIAAALIVLERLREKCELSITAHLTEGGAQIAGLSLSSLRKILERFGETREFPSEGGRTNRGNNKPVQQLLDGLKRSGLGGLPDKQRSKFIDEMQRFLVESLDAYYKLERIRFNFDAAKPARGLIGDILGKAQERNQGGPVAQQLVGAKLAIRFPHLQIGNFAYSAADEQAGRPGDFHVGNTAFHVTVAPTMGHIARCANNIHEGLGAFLIVIDAKLTAARALLETERLEGKVAAESVESFVGQNISELAEFAPARFSEKLKELLKEYNRRVREVETDRSLLIEIPGSMGDRED